VRLYYASDIHGSETCWRKFLNAGPFYGADLIVMGGDLTGKGIVPIVAQGDGTWTAQFKGRKRELRDEAELSALEGEITFNGMYPYRCDPDDVAALAQSAERQDELFDDLMERTFARWLEIADEKLSTNGVRCFVMPGNDDAWAIDRAFDRTSRVQNCDRSVVDLGDGYTLLSVGFSNPTPWKSPRELAEDELYRIIAELAEQVPSMERALFNLHVPPRDSELDSAPAIDEDFRIQFSGGQPVMAPAGSTAVREAIERYQPLLALHGHIHESKGSIKIGRTLCLNPGSSYGLGQLDGVIVELKGDKVRRHQFLVGERMNAETPEVLVPGGAEVGEGPVWDADGHRLIWVDITRCLLHAYDPADGTDAATNVGQPLGVAIPRRAGGLVLALGCSFGLLEPGGEVEIVATVPEADPSLRMNDGNCDSAGRFFAGTMDYDSKPEAGALYRLDPDGEVTRVLDAVTISNGIDWSPDDRRMYFVDSATYRVDAWNYDVSTGAFKNRRPFVTWAPEDGLPDGLTVDAEGFVWVASWGGACLRRYSPDGALDRVVGLPTRNITSCAFGGAGLDELYVTSATEELTPADLEAEPHAGALFRVRPGVRGRPQRLFGG
jgi:sugar lactone lactonase YvrE/Icc-related predicted phosphoesterase